MNFLNQLWAWYGRVGRPIHLKTTFPPTECRRRLSKGALDWHQRAPLSMQPFKVQLTGKRHFRLKYRRPLSQMSGRIFEGTLTKLDDGTEIRGTVRHERGFLGFVLVVLLIAPLGGSMYWGNTGITIGLLIGLLLFGAAIFVRITEERSPLWETFHDWLCETLHAVDVTPPAKPPRAE